MSMINNPYFLFLIGALHMSFRRAVDYQSSVFGTMRIRTPKSADADDEPKG